MHRVVLLCVCVSLGFVIIHSVTRTIVDPTFYENPTVQTAFAIFTFKRAYGSQASSQSRLSFRAARFSPASAVSLLSPCAYVCVCMCTCGMCMREKKKKIPDNALARRSFDKGKRYV